MTNMMSMTNPIAIGAEAQMIDGGWSLDKELTKLIDMNPLMILYLTINLFNSCHDFVHDPLTSDTKDNLWMYYHVLIMTYKY